MKLKNYLIWVIAFLMTSFAYSQEVSGTVTDDSNTPLVRSEYNC